MYRPSIMYFGCLDSKTTSLNIRINSLVSGLFLLIFGIQGLAELFNETIQQFKYIRMLSTIFIIFGSLMTIMPFIRCGKKKKYDPIFYGDI